MSSKDRKELTGQRFGRLVALADVGRKRRRVVWRCQCDCGNISDISSAALLSGATTSCGCYNKERSTETHVKDRRGQVYGRLTVLEEAGRKNRGLVWKCLCECGNIVDVTASSLHKGDTQSCGCLKRERAFAALSPNLTGLVFGRLTVIGEGGRTKHHRVLWECQCTCGNSVCVISSHLTSGKTKSCGCYHRDRASECHSGANSYRWKGGITPVYQAIRTSQHYTHWRTDVFERDKYVCQGCGDTAGGNLHAHHIKHLAALIAEYEIHTLVDALHCSALWDAGNGLTLCWECHVKEHRGTKLTKRGSKPKKKKSLDGNISDFKFSV